MYDHSQCKESLLTNVSELHNIIHSLLIAIIFIEKSEYMESQW